MVKIFYRTLVILLVAGLVAGGIYAFAASGSMSLPEPGGREGRSHGAPDGAALNAGGASMPPRPDGGHEGGEGFSLAGLAGVIVQAVKIALITALVAAVKAVARLFSRRKPARAAA